MTTFKLGFKLNVIMAEYRIKAKDLAKAMGCSPTAISNLRRSNELPELGGKKLGLLASALSELANKQLTPLDLIDCKPNEIG